jgi:putative SOS response-associated peptidase YedK
MCYDISFKVSYFPNLILDEQLELQWPQFDHTQGVSVFAPHPIIYRNKEDKLLHMRNMEWSCIEYYTKEEPDWKKRNGMLNARSERVFDKKSYWYKIREKRCLIPLSGTYEHRGILGWKKKVPYFVRPKDQSFFFLPGLYSVAQLPDKQTGEMITRWTFTLLTRNANEVMRQIHNSGDNPHRMPLFLPLDMSLEFISEGLSEDQFQHILQYEIPSEDLLYYPVNTIRTSKPRNDNKEKDEPFDWDGKVPPLGTLDPPLAEKQRM